MPTPRSQIVDEREVGTYHCISRCVRQERLLGRGLEHRRDWIERRIAELQTSMAIDVVAWNILSNHLHLIVTIRPDRVASWSDSEVAERYCRLFPGRRKRCQKGAPCTGGHAEREVKAITSSPERLAMARQRLSSLSWFMRELKTPISRRANLEDGVKGAFWDQRFRSIRVLDEIALLAVAIYVDLNAVRAGLVDRPENTPHGSISERVAALTGVARRTSIRLEPPPLEPEDAYVELVDGVGRSLRPGKASIPRNLPPILDRLGLTTRRWARILKDGISNARGTVIGTEASRRAEAARRGCRWVIDLIAVPQTT
jgi:REP element-mobilizing transposase RayT